MSELVNAAELPDPVVAAGDLESRILRRIRDEHFSKFLNPQSSLADIRQARLGYHASIALVDLEFGRVLDALEEANLAENTLVIFVSDHGDLLGDHQQFTKGAAMYDPCVRVPLLMRWPVRLQGGQRLKQLVQLHDLAATVLSAAGVAQSERERYMPESSDLIRLRTGDSRVAHEFAVCCFRNSGLSRLTRHTIYFDPPIHSTMIRDDRFKMIVYHELETAGDEGQLFDMQDDPLENQNLWDDKGYREIRRKMTQHLLSWQVAQEARYLGARGGHSEPESPWWK